MDDCMYDWLDECMGGWMDDCMGWVAWLTVWILDGGLYVWLNG